MLVKVVCCSIGWHGRHVAGLIHLNRVSKAIYLLVYINIYIRLVYYI